ncbi:MAG: DUF2971 domain-containing protein [Candidatus Fimivivens sp.]|nr:DUF2971 domain-containing protein [Candidatus Fimivivens sp.]
MDDIINKRILTISNNINAEDHLFRYVPLAQFIALIENKKIYLRKIKLWDDPWEAPDDQLPMVSDNGNLVYPESLLTTSTVGQCWTYEKDSDAMWRIYSSDRQGVMIETVAKDFILISDLRRASLSKVIYYNEKNYIEKRREIQKNSSYSFAGDMALKREAFKHENEVRLLVCLQHYPKMEDMWDVPVVGFDVKIENFIKSITFDPRADDWFVETMKKYCDSKEIDCSVKKSSLYDKDFFQRTQFVMKYEVVKDK